jgi:FKBP-type peptidyl-prolyl cis-trans isomerase FkpA
MIVRRPFAAACLLALLPFAAACSLFGPKPDPAEDRKSQTDRTRLEIIEVAPGSGAEARPGRHVAVHYTGWLYHPDKPAHHGRQFDSSRDRGEPIDFTIGAGEMIPGWDEGIPGMKVGGKRTLVVPPNMAYGRRGRPGIPENATLVFDVELMSVR